MLVDLLQDMNRKDNDMTNSHTEQVITHLKKRIEMLEDDVERIANFLVVSGVTFIPEHDNIDKTTKKE